MSKIVQSDEFLRNISSLGNLDRKVIKDLDMPLGRDHLPVLASNLVPNATSKFEREIIEKGVFTAGKECILFTSHEDINDIIKIIKSSEYSNVLIDGITEIVNHKIKKQERGILPALLAPLVALLVQPVISSVVKGISRRGVRRAGRGYMGKAF